MNLLLLQDYLGPDDLAGGDIFGVLVEAFTYKWPIPIAAIVIFGSIGAAYYLVQERIIVPLVMLIVVGGVTVARAPPIYLEGIAAALVLVFTGLAFFLINRWRA